MARVYPVPRPEAGTDSRFTFGLARDVADVLERHGYPPITDGRDLMELKVVLFRFLYGEVA